MVLIAPRALLSCYFPVIISHARADVKRKKQKSGVSPVPSDRAPRRRACKASRRRARPPYRLWRQIADRCPRTRGHGRRKTEPRPNTLFACAKGCVEALDRTSPFRMLQGSIFSFVLFPWFKIFLSCANRYIIAQVFSGNLLQIFCTARIFPLFCAF